jgi:hypothetical protein
MAAVATKTYSCSFCGKSQRDVRWLISGPSVYICDECVELCIDILEEKGVKLREVQVSSDDVFKALEIKPRFQKLSFAVKPNHCFLLCPFKEPFDAVYNDHIAKAVRQEGFTIERADDIFGTDPIIEDIWEAINSATIVIADVTGRNPNVMYEIGMAHTVGKPVVIITQRIDDVPFDLKHYRCIVYEYTPRGCMSLEEKLAGTLRFLRQRNPVAK